MLVTLQIRILKKTLKYQQKWINLVSLIIKSNSSIVEKSKLNIKNIKINQIVK